MQKPLNESVSYLVADHNEHKHYMNQDLNEHHLKPIIDIIIPTYNRGDLIMGTLKSLKANSFSNFKIWIVDQSDNPKTAETVQPFLEEDNRFALIRTNRRGADIARNIGINAGNASIVALIDDDCRVTDTWLETLLTEFETHPTIDSIFGRVIPGNIPEAHCQKTDVAQIQRLQEILPMAKKDNCEHKLFIKNRFNLGFGHGANMSFRRSTFEKFGLFDEYLGGGTPLCSWEERDIGYRILSGGGTILFSPSAVVYHDHWREWSGVRTAYRNYGIGTGAAVGKYFRLGDWASIWLLVDWMLQQGVRQIFSGIFKWQSWQKTYVGFLQLVYPWLGLIYSMKYAIDPQGKVYIGLKSDHPRLP